ncbi:hypothetical protein [Cohnella nanjingensis]|uniref:Ferric oxidoreductase domain-containing protein n=1 Tax=Cohnella nanjingensis TaxID=1387779 RepID=A0A7X0VDA8_9BACL|nr:hypothetical protein [Cohnella nanjingensis]MBB6669506.1 hypothetical protein [Cohnella nanjingensis]
MSKNKKVWIPAIIAAFAALLLVASFYYAGYSHEGEALRARLPGGGGGGLPAGEAQRPPRDGNEGYGGYFTTLGTIALYVGAAGFSWFWFKKRMKSPSRLVRRGGKLLFAWHKLMGWITVALIAIHGTYFLWTKFGDDKIYSGLAGFVILLTLAGYGYFIHKIRNKWMRTVHRSLGLLWVPVLIVHAGGSAIMAVLAVLVVGVVVLLLEKNAGTSRQPSSGV